MLSSNGTDKTGLSSNGTDKTGLALRFLGGAPASFCGCCPGDVPVAAGAAAATCGVFLLLADAPRRGFSFCPAPASFCGCCPGDVPVAAGAAAATCDATSFCGCCTDDVPVAAGAAAATCGVFLLLANVPVAAGAAAATCSVSSAASAAACCTSLSAGAQVTTTTPGIGFAINLGVKKASLTRRERFRRLVLHAQMSTPLAIWTHMFTSHI